MYSHLTLKTAGRLLLKQGLSLFLWYSLRKFPRSFTPLDKCSLRCWNRAGSKRWTIIFWSETSGKLMRDSETFVTAFLPSLQPALLQWWGSWHPAPIPLFSSLHLFPFMVLLMGRRNRDSNDSALCPANALDSEPGNSQHCLSSALPSPEIPRKLLHLLGSWFSSLWKQEEVGAGSSKIPVLKILLEYKHDKSDHIYW